MKILVTGGAGFIGSHIVDLCLARGHDVSAIDNLSTGKRNNLPPNVPLHEVDVQDPAVMEIVRREKPDFINHQAAQVSVAASVRDPFFDAQTNILGAVNILEAARRAAVPRVLFSSSGGTYYGEVKDGGATEEGSAEPASPYGISKSVAESYLFWYGRHYQMKVVSLRYANVYGPRQDPHGEAGVVAIFSMALQKGQPPTINGDGEYIRDYVHGADVAEVNMLAMEQGWAGAFNVGTGRETTVNQLFERLKKISGKNLRPVYGPPRPGDLRRNVLSMEKVKQTCGWVPRHPLEQGLAETYTSFQSLKKES